MKIDRLTCTTALQQKSITHPALILAARHQRAMSQQNQLGVQDTKSVLLYYLYIRSSLKKATTISIEAQQHNAHTAK
jgi:hypothetical protein